MRPHLFFFLFHARLQSRSAALVIALFVLCGWTNAAEFSYEATTSSLEYSYTTVDDTPDGDVSWFSITTPTGTLTGTVTVVLGDGTVEFFHVESGQTARNSYLQEPGKNGIWNGHLEVPGLVDTFYQVNVTTNEFSTLATAPGYYCTVMEGTAYYAMMKDATLKLNEEIEALGETGTPFHLSAIASLVTLTKFAPNNILCPVATDPQGGGCYYGWHNPPGGTYDDCVECCTPPGLLTSVVNIGCAAAGASLCAASGAAVFWTTACAGAGAAACNGMVNIAENECIIGQCTGAPGNPGCAASQVCSAEDGNQCMNFCGINHQSACGTCTNPNQTQCCTI